MSNDFCVQRNLTGASLSNLQAAIRDDFKDDTKPKQVQYRFDGNNLVTVTLKTWDKKPFAVKIVEKSFEPTILSASEAEIEAEALRAKGFPARVAGLMEGCIGGLAIASTLSKKDGKAFFQKVELFTEFSQNADADLVRAVNDVVVPFNRDHFHAQAVVTPAPSKDAKVVDADGVKLSVAIANRV